MAIFKEQPRDSLFKHKYEEKSHRRRLKLKLPPITGAGLVIFIGWLVDPFQKGFGGWDIPGGITVPENSEKCNFFLDRRRPNGTTLNIRRFIVPHGHVVAQPEGCDSCRVPNRWSRPGQPDLRSLQG